MESIDERLKELGKSQEWLVKKADVKLDELADENPDLWTAYKIATAFKSSIDCLWSL